MWSRLRKTARRGRPAEPAMVRRIRSWRLRRAAPRLASCVIRVSPSFSWCFLLSGDLADQLLVDADDRQASRILELEADAVRRVDLDRVAVAQVERQLLATQR